MIPWQAIAAVAAVVFAVVGIWTLCLQCKRDRRAELVVAARPRAERISIDPIEIHVRNRRDGTAHDVRISAVDISERGEGAVWHADGPIVGLGGATLTLTRPASFVEPNWPFQPEGLVLHWRDGDGEKQAPISLT